MSVCPNCNQSLEGVEADNCPHCGARIGEEEAIGSESPPPPDRSSVPFEDTSIPFFTRLLETIKLAFTSPRDLFSNMRDGDIQAPVIYAVILGAVGGAFGAMWQLWFGSIASVAERAGFEEFALQTGLVIFFMILSPVFALIGLFIHTGIYHVMLLLMGDGERGFSISLRAVAYGQTPVLLGILPICGGTIGGIWSMVLVILGAFYGHGTDGWRAAAAYFLPFILCCCGGFGLLMMGGLLGGM
jgi:hypothetical protein